MLSTPAQIGYMAEPPIPTTPFTPVPVSGSGLLSQILQNLQHSIQHLAALTALPNEAQIKRNTAIVALAAEIKKIIDAQPVVKQFVADTRPRLQRAKADLDAGTNLDQVAATINQTRTAAEVLKQRLDALSTDTNATRSLITDLSTSLAPFQRMIQERQTEVNGQIENLRRELSDPWTVFKDVMSGRLEELKEQAYRLFATINSLRTCAQSVDSVITDFSGVINQISYLDNAVQFVVGDDKGVIGDLQDAQGEQLLANVYLTAAISQLKALEADAA